MPAEWVGFKVDKLRDFSMTTQEELKAKVVNSIVADLDDEWRGQTTGLSADFAQVTQGIYVLCLDEGLCVNYAGGKSRVLYIGKGRIRQRIKSHLEKKLLDFFLQLPWIQFSFYMTEPDSGGNDSYFHDYEHDLLEEFSKLYGAWPMFNKKPDRRHSNAHSYRTNWKLPLKNTKAGYVWALTPTVIKASLKFQD